MAARRNRIQLSAVDSFLDKVSMLGIEVEPPLSPQQAKANLFICIRHHLTVYDAAYLELAKRRGAELATWMTI